MADASAKILVVDDYAHNRLIYREWLAELGDVEVVDAPGGQRALQLAREHDFAMFLLDVNLPDLDGFELASLLRQEPRAESTPIVFVTSEATERNYLMRGYRMGAVDFMASASTLGEILVQKARVFIQMYRKRRELQGLVERSQRETRELQQKLDQFIREHDVLRAQATHDALTKLPNRALFQDRLCAALARSARNRQRFALAYVDLDGFKAVNDRHGHGTGDALILAVGERLKHALRATDTVARLGGDEFALLFEGLDSGDAAQYVAEKLHKALVAPYLLASQVEGRDVEVAIGASIGAVLYPDHATDVDRLISLADMTMYAVKRSGGGARLYPGEIGRSAAGETPPPMHLVRKRPG